MGSPKRSPPAGPTGGPPGTLPPLAKTQKESLEEPNSMITRVDTVIDVNNDSGEQIPVIEHVEVIPWNQGSGTTRNETIKAAN